ncbi:unnamed protein product [Cochlearia groenlandica]
MMNVSLFIAFIIVLSLCFHTSVSDFIQFSTISVAPSSFSPFYPPAMSPDISPLLPTPGSNEMSPSPSDSPVIPSSLSPPNPDDIITDPLLDSSPVGSPLPASSSLCLVFSPLLSLMLLLALCKC